MEDDGSFVKAIEGESLLAAPCGTCLSLGWPPGCPPHGAQQHFACWAGRQPHDPRGPAWQVVLSEAPPAGWKPPHDWINIDSFVAALPKGTQVVWRQIRRPEG